MTDDTLITLGGASWRTDEEPDGTGSDGTGSDGTGSDGTGSDGTGSDGGAQREGHNDFGPDDEESEWSTNGLSPVNIRNFSVKCGYCGNYQVIVGFRQIDEDWNEYVYECDEPPCSGDIQRSRTVLEIPAALDEYSRRDPSWHGGKVHAGAQHGSDASDE